MTDAEKREKVMRGLECCSPQHGGTELCEQCPYYKEPFPCANTLLYDALALLREQDAVKPIGGYGCFICGVCKNPLFSVSQKFCSECGRAVKWDDGT